MGRMDRTGDQKQKSAAPSVSRMGTHTGLPLLKDDLEKGEIIFE